MAMFSKDKTEEAIKNIKQISKTLKMFSIECPFCKDKFEYENYNQTVHLFKSHLQTHQ